MLSLNVPESLSLEERIRERDRRIDASVNRRMRLAKAKPLVTLSDDPVADAINLRTSVRPKVYSLPSVKVAMGVPAIHRAIALISSTTGMLSMQGYRDGVVMDGRDGRPAAPGIVVRPDPDQTPYAFYSTSAANMAKYGEIVWWIANFDTDGRASALVNVPLLELSVTQSGADRRYPRYQWGTLTGTRWSPANPTGRFVHLMFPLGEPYDLRGQGPLQRCGAAVSVSVESQEWAANFYGRGGYPREIIKHAGELSPERLDEFGTPDPVNGLSEAERLKVQYVYRDNNTPIVIDSRIEDIKSLEVNPQGAQMLDARTHQKGDAANMFSLPGKFVEYVQSGTSLTYSTLETAFTDLVKTCLQPLYFEPIEQAMSDLLTRSTVARFNVKGFLRADIKTRFDVHGIAIDKGIYDAAYAQREEGIAPGDVEFAPVPASQPAAVPSSIPRLLSGEMREVRCPSCQRLIVKAAGAVEGLCRHCKTIVTAA